MKSCVFDIRIVVENLLEFKKIIFKLFFCFCVLNFNWWINYFIMIFFRIVLLIWLVDFWLKIWYWLVNRRINMISEYFWIIIVDWLKIKMYDWIFLREILIYFFVFIWVILKGGGCYKVVIILWKKYWLKYWELFL